MNESEAIRIVRDALRDARVLRHRIYSIEKEIGMRLDEVNDCMKCGEPVNQEVLRDSYGKILGICSGMEDII